MRVTEYVPGFFEGFERRVVEVKSLAQLLEIPWIKSWWKDPRFKYFRETNDYLLAVMVVGQYVIAKMEPINTESERIIVFPPWNPEEEVDHG